MFPSKKSSTKFSRPAEARKIPSKLAALAKKPLVVLAAVALVPVFVMMAFTFKSGYTPPAKGRTDKIVVVQTPIEIAEEATSALRKGDNERFLELLDTKVRKDVNMVNGRGNTLLMEAVSMGNVEAVQNLLALGIDVNKKNAFTRDTALIKALDITAEKKQTPPNDGLIARKAEIARLLIYADADINVENNYKQSPMYLAVENRLGEFVDLFLTSGVRIGLNTDTLFRSVATKNYVGVMAMLKGGIDPNIKNDKGNTPLIISASIGDLPSVQALMAYRADVNAANNDGNTSLIYAARYNQPKVIRELMKPQTMQAPLDVDMQNKKGETALYWAAAKGYQEPVLRLLAAGADRTIASKSGLTPLQAAEKYKRTKIVPLFSLTPVEIKNRVITIDNADIVAAAKAAGEPVPALTPEEGSVAPAVAGEEQIFEAVRKGDLALVRTIVQGNKAAVFQKDKFGNTPLLAAVKARQLDMARLLADNMSRLFETSNEGNVFHLAVKNRDLEMLQMLVSLARAENRLGTMLEAKAEASNKQLMTPLGFAALDCAQEIYNYLVSVGAKPGSVSNKPNLLGFYTPAELMRKCKTYKPSYRRAKAPAKR